MEIKIKDGYVIVHHGKNTVYLTKNGYVLNSNTYKYIMEKDIRPLDGFAIENDEIEPYNGKPPTIVKKYGVTHYFAGFDTMRKPIYVADIGFYVITKDFRSYKKYEFGQHKETLQWHDVQKIASELEKKRKYNTIMINDNRITTRVDLKNRVVAFEYGFVDGVALIKIPFDDIDDKNNTFSEDELLNYVAEWEARIPDGVKKYIKEVNNTSWDSVVSITYELSVGRSFYFTDYNSGEIMYNSTRMNIKDLPNVIENSVESISRFMERVPPDPLNFQGDVREIIESLVGKKEFTKSYAVDGKRIFTGRGKILVKDIEYVDQKYWDLAAHILYLKDLIQKNELMINLVLDGNMSGAKFYTLKKRPKSKYDVPMKIPPVVRIGEKYFWYNNQTASYVSDTNLVIMRTPLSIKYSGSKIYVGETMDVTHSVIEKINKGEKIQISDIIPGMPKSARIKNGIVEVGKKKMELWTNRYRLGTVARVPYREGVFKVYIPYNADFDPWTPDSIEDVPKEYIVGTRYRINFADDTPDIVKIEYYRGSELNAPMKLKIIWENGFLEITERWADKIEKLTIEHNGKQTTVSGTSDALAVLSAKTLDDAFGIAYVL